MPENFKFDHLITYAEAGKYLDNIQDQDLLNISKTNLGGIINASHFKTLGNDFSGIMIWFCLEESGSFYLAFEGKFGFSYDPAEVEKVAPSAAELIRSSEIFGDNLSGNRETYIRSHSHKVPANDLKVPLAKVEKDSKRYLLDPVFSKHQKYGFAFFGNSEGHVSTFLQQTGLEYIGFYLGYDGTLNINKIRIILAPVGIDGKNLEFDLAKSEYQLLEKSVPPPPNH